MESEMISLFTKVGGATTICFILLRGIMYLYKDMMNVYSQTRLDGLKREEELTKCFENITEILKNINSTMKDINSRLLQIEKKVI